MSETLVTKNELAAQYGISWRTVYRTLKLCTLNTSKLRYTPHEQLLFKLARTLLQSGWSSDQVHHLIVNHGVLEALSHFHHHHHK